MVQKLGSSRLNSRIQTIDFSLQAQALSSFAYETPRGKGPDPAIRAIYEKGSIISSAMACKIKELRNVLFCSEGREFGETIDS
ncbi:MAG: hypothetical protein JSS12_10240 [Verrucomicrobia bacterium]|nr:hypothetical protein [Verrucomicrobiota bacterium]